MKILDVFERDPSRLKDYVIKVTDEDRKEVGTEVDEYVVTPLIREDITTIIDSFIESRLQPTRDVCSWISGFFGSGKSHLLKIIGYVLANREIELPDGAVVGAAEFFCKKNELEYGPILSKELKSRSLFVHMLDYDRHEHGGPTITRMVYKALLKDTGYSDYFWIAEIEKFLQQRGAWQAFLSFVRSEKAGVEWQKVRKNVISATNTLANGLAHVLPEEYPTVESARASIEDVKRDFEIKPSRLAQLLKEEALKLGQDSGRIIILLDEVGLYVGEDPDRLGELNVLPEMISQYGNGKVWLFVTAQEAPEQIIQRLAKHKHQLDKIRDRFPLKYQLVPENIDIVVKKRLLDKTSRGSAEIGHLFDAHSGALSMAATIKNPARLIPLLTEIKKEQFSESYPLLPYHVRLIQEILGLLRSQNGASGRGAKRERAALSVVQKLLVTDFGDGKLTDAEVGRLVTFDAVYGAIEGLLKVESEVQSTISSDIAKLGLFEGLRIVDVAKAVYLLQQVGDWLPCTLENIAAVLYPQLGTDNVSHENRVAGCLRALTNEQWVSKEEGNYRFLTKIERSFDQEVRDREPFVSDKAKRGLIFEQAQSILKAFNKVNYKRKAFDVAIESDDEKVTSRGYLQLCFFSPYYVNNDEGLRDELLKKSLDRDNVLYWISEIVPEFEEIAARIIATRQVLHEKQNSAQSRDEQEALKRPRNALSSLEDELEKNLDRAARRGTFVHLGTEYGMENSKDASEVVKAKIKDIIEIIFTEYDLADVQIEQENELINKILLWAGSSLPAVFKDLQLIDDNNNILTTGPVASLILTEITKRREGDNTGQDLITFFEDPPYGWDPRVVRITLATFFRNGTINVDLNGRIYESPDELGSSEAFTSIKFKRAHFLQGIVVSVKKRDEIKEEILELFGVGAGNTVDEIDKKLIEIIDVTLPTATRLSITASTLKLPISSPIRNFRDSLQKIRDTPGRSQRLLSFAQEFGVLKEAKPTFEAFERFTEHGKVDQYTEVEHFVSYCSAPLISMDAKYNRDLQKIRSDMQSPEFIKRWSTIHSEYERLQAVYTSTYNGCHAKLRREVNKALNLLRKHDCFKEGSAQEGDLEPLKQLLCTKGDVQGLTQAPYLCSECSSQVLTLKEQISSIPTLKNEVSHRLDERCKKGEAEPVKPLLIDKSPVSPDDVQKTLDELALNEISTWSEQAALKHENVRILLRIEVINEQQSAR